MHNANATADVSTRNGTSAAFGQHNDCQDRDDTERTRPVTTPSVPPPHDLRPRFVPLEHAYATYDASLTYISDEVVLFWHTLRFSPSERHRRSLWVLMNIIVLNSA